MLSNTLCPAGSVISKIASSSIFYSFWFVPMLPTVCLQIGTVRLRIRCLMALSAFGELVCGFHPIPGGEAERRSEEHTSELQSLMRTSYAVFCLQKKKQT